MKFKKKGGVVGDIISGTGGLILLTVIVLIIVSTLLATDLFSTSATSFHAVINETDTDSGLFVNETGIALTRANASNSGYAITAVWNATDDGVGYFNLSIPTTNITVSATGVVTNATVFDWTNVSLSYTFTYSVDNKYKVSTDNMGTNFTKGLDNVSTKIPTILLIAAVVLLFGVIVLLVKQAGAMGIGEGGASL